MKLRSSLIASLPCVAQIHLILTIECSLGVVLYTTPQDFDGIKDNSSVIVAGSVIQLFCSASGQFTAPHIQWTRNNITILETAQLPHLMIKSRTENNTTTSSTLTIVEFLETDNGGYSCLARETGGSTVISPPLSLIVTVTNGMIKVIRELGNYSDDRTYVPLGSPSGGTSGTFLRCSAEQPGSSLLAAPSLTWLKDGTQLFDDGVRVVINTTKSTILASNRTVSFVRIFNFSQSDAGVYQCVFYDTPSQGGEVITTRPYKVDTGPIKLTTTFPSVITLCPPEPLVIQVEAGGEYGGIQWTRTPRPLNITSDQLVDFGQTFVMNQTSADDNGTYVINLMPPANSSTRASLNFDISLSAANPPFTTAAPDMVITKPGVQVEVVCTSSGYPTPNVTWYYQLGNQASVLGPLPPSVNVGQPFEVCNGVCKSCTASSHLYILSVSSTIHQGVYLCVGANIINGNTILSTASVNLVVMSDNASSTVASLPTPASSSADILLVAVIISVIVISAVIIVPLAIGLIAVIVQLRKKNCDSKQGLNNTACKEMRTAEIDVVPKPQEIPGYSRLFQDTPFYQPHRSRGAFNTQSVPALAALDHNELRESKSSASFLDTPLPRGYEKPVSSIESIPYRTGDQAIPDHPMAEVSSQTPAGPVYTDNEQEEDFVTVDELVEMNQKRVRGGTNHHRYVDQGTSPSARQLLSSTSALDLDN